MADNIYSNENAIARILLLWTDVFIASPKLKEQQKIYDARMRVGGKPDTLGESNNYSSNQFEVVVTRQDSTKFAQTGQYQKYIRAWQGMPLFAGDVIESGANLNATLEWLSGGYFYVVNKGVWRINGDRDATNYHYKYRSVAYKFLFEKEKPLTVQRRGGAMGTRG